MSVYVDQKSRILIQGITGHEGLFHAQQMLNYGSSIVAGVTPGKGGEWVLEGKVPVFDSVQKAVEITAANVSIIFVPARYALDAMFEAVEARIELIICITEGIPVRDLLLMMNYLDGKNTRLVGPNSPGILTPGVSKAGIIPGSIAIPGNIGIVSRSGTLTYEVLYALQKENIGVSTCVGIGGDPVIGTTFVDVLEAFEADPQTDKIVLIGEIGGNDEEMAAEFIAKRMTKPVVAFIAGQTAPPGKRMGHAGAIIEGNAGNAIDKIRTFQEIGVMIARYPDEMPSLLSE
ncbi:MAG: succinate--CoA ligase subunit alpha [Anaerolineaceae bacterium]|nr:succinate--CoA ligase subunit alpha [Anaerolineaceae bacterium]